MNQDVIKWLLEGDPVIRFQTKRDLLELDKEEWNSDKEDTLKEGWGKQLLDLQDPSGTWGGGLYGPKFTSTHYTLLLLRRFEIPPNAQTAKGCSHLIKIDSIGKTSTKESEKIGTCITGMGLGIIAYFQQYESLFDDILNYLEDNKLEDGGWNCRHPRIDVNHSSVNTTLSVLEGLRELKKNYATFSSRIEKLEKPAQEFLLLHDLYKSHKTGEIMNSHFIDISFPPRWKYNILSALDYFQSITYPKDQRMNDALEIISQKSRNGYWYKGRQMSGKLFFKLDPPRKPSSFNTLRALKVLKEYDNSTYQDKISVKI